MQPNPTNQDSSSVASTDHSATLYSTAPVGPQPISLSPGILDQLVPWMADAVTRRLSSPNETSTTPINNTSRPSALSEVLLVFSTHLHQTVVSHCLVYQLQLPGMAGAIVLGSLNTTQASSSDGSHVLRAIFIDKLSMAIKY